MRAKIRRFVVGVHGGGGGDGFTQSEKHKQDDGG